LALFWVIEVQTVDRKGIRRCLPESNDCVAGLSVDTAINDVTKGYTTFADPADTSLNGWV
jgi:hypothetical protein